VQYQFNDILIQIDTLMSYCRNICLLQAADANQRKNLWFVTLGSKQKDIYRESYTIWTNQNIPPFKCNHKTDNSLNIYRSICYTSVRWVPVQCGAFRSQISLVLWHLHLWYDHQYCKLPALHIVLIISYFPWYIN